MAFVFVLVRVGSMLAFLPFLGGRVVPAVVKALLSLVVSVLLFPFVQNGAVVPPLDDPLAVLLTAGAEVTFGALMGFCALVIFQAVRQAGEMIGRQMGMAMARAADPVSGVQATVVGNFCDALAVLVLFALGGHRWFMAGIYQSFEHWPMGQFVAPEFIKNITVWSAVRGFALAFQLAAPLLVLMFMIALLMAIMARLVPEINILIVGFPLRIGIGLAGLALLVPLLVRHAGKVCEVMIQFFTTQPTAT